MKSAVLVTFDNSSYIVETFPDPKYDITILKIKSYKPDSILPVVLEGEQIQEFSLLNFAKFIVRQSGSQVID